MTYFIGICGGSGAGKTFLANLLKEHYGKDLTIINYDSYCKSDRRLSLEHRSKQNYDIPSSYDGKLLYKQMKALKSGKDIDVPSYDFASHKRSESVTHIRPNKIIVIEGIMVFQVERLLPIFNLSIFVDAKEEVRFERRLRRDVKERGRTSESVHIQFKKFVKPMHDIYIEPMKNCGDIIINNNENIGIILGFDNIIKLIDKAISE